MVQWLARLTRYRWMYVRHHSHTKILFKIGYLYKDYMHIAVYLFEVIWFIYTYDRIKTLTRLFFKDYDKNMVFRDCQVHFFNIYMRRKQILLIIFRYFVEVSANNINMINRCWPTFDTLA